MKPITRHVKQSKLSRLGIFVAAIAATAQLFVSCATLERYASDPEVRKVLQEVAAGAAAGAGAGAGDSGSGGRSFSDDFAESLAGPVRMRGCRSNEVRIDGQFPRCVFMSERPLAKAEAFDYCRTHAAVPQSGRNFQEDASALGRRTGGKVFWHVGESAQDVGPGNLSYAVGGGRFMQTVNILPVAHILCGALISGE